MLSSGSRSTNAQHTSDETEAEPEIQLALSLWFHLNIPQEKLRYQRCDDVAYTGETCNVNLAQALLEAYTR